MEPVTVILIVLGVVLVAVPAAVVGLLLLGRPVFRWIWAAITHVGRFIGSELGDLLRVFGALLTAVVLVPIAVANLILWRKTSAQHYGRAITAELLAMIGALYRVFVGNPARLLMLSALTEGIEQRVPAAIAHAPLHGGVSGPRGRATQFEGYEIVGTMQGGGSGARLYIAEPTKKKAASLAREGHTDVGRVVIKSFSLREGSTLPQIVRESRALLAAQRLDLIIEHELTEERFYYVTRYVPGESLGVVIGRLHGEADANAKTARASRGSSRAGTASPSSPSPTAAAKEAAMLGGAAGLDEAKLKEAVGYAADLLKTLSRYHAGGLWHKDVKPDNIIVHEGHASLVDFGLVTPLRSSMTLTTHGTEYFRDPEMVRMALRGVKVHEVEGAKFDVYAAGAVLYAMIEGSFPAHGGLSQITRPCPEALRWVVRRAMTDYDKRYATAAEMLADVEALLAAPEMSSMRPADLPSVKRGEESVMPVAARSEWEELDGAAGRFGRGVLYRAAVEGFPPEPHEELGKAGWPRLKVMNWWSGRYVVESARASDDGSSKVQSSKFN